MAGSTKLAVAGMTGFAKLKEEVIGTGLCAFCGACIGVCPSKCLVANYQRELPEAIKECPPQCNICYEVCPGKDVPLPELNRMVFGREPNASEEVLGIMRYCGKAWATDPVVRGRAASGGLCTALIIYALEKGIIDAAILTGSSEKEPWIAVPKIATNRQEVIACQHTKNYCCPTLSVWNEALERGYQRLGLVGVSYHVHAFRKMQLDGKLTKLLQSIKFVIGVGAGAGKAASRVEHEHLIEEVLGVPLAEVAEVVLHGHQYPAFYGVITEDGRIFGVRDTPRHTHWRGFGGERVGYDWTCGLADIMGAGYFGRDATRGLSGISVAFVRTEIGEKLMKDAETAGYIATEPLDRDKLPGASMNLSADTKFQARQRILTLKRFGHPVPDYHIPEELLQYPKRVRQEVPVRVP